MGIDIIRDKNGIILSQKNYIEKVLKKFGFLDVNPNSILMDPKFNRESSTEKVELEDITWYQSAIVKHHTEARGGSNDIAALKVSAKQNWKR